MATDDTARAPRAVIHKRILEAAESRPEASMEALAADLAGASPALVERVLEEYGDPGSEPPLEGPESGAGAPAPEETAEAMGGEASPTAAHLSPPDQTRPTDGGPMTDTTTPPTDAELTDKQREALQAIAEHPEATQAELADLLGVSRATVNKRVNGIAGFEWSDRQAFVSAVFDDASADTPEPADESSASGDGAAHAAADAASNAAAAGDPPAPSMAASDGGQLLSAGSEHAIEQLQERVARLERHAEDAADIGDAAIEDAALLAKVLRAVMAADDITEDEEVAVLEALR